MRLPEDELSPRARGALDAYREATRVAPDRRARLWEHIQEDLAPATTIVDARARWRRPEVWIAAGIAIAAAVLLALELGPRLTSTSRGSDEAVHEAAPYELEEPPTRAASRAQPQRTSPRDAAATAEPLAAGDEPRAAPDKPVSPVITIASEPETPRTRARPTPARDADDERPADALARELALLGQARAALRAGQPAEALARLAEHERVFAAGQLLEDRLALRVEALCALEDASGPRESAEFLARYPRSPHAARVREACP